MKVKSYRELVIWQKGIKLVKKIYKITDQFPKQESFGLSAQLQRAAVSVPSNIAEGQAREHTGDFRRFLFISIGSIAEIDTQLEIAKQLGYISDTDFSTTIEFVIELRKMIHGLIKKLPNK